MIKKFSLKNIITTFELTEINDRILLNKFSRASIHFFVGI